MSKMNMSRFTPWQAWTYIDCSLGVVSQIANLYKFHACLFN
jgi:hypothetical protein